MAARALFFSSGPFLPAIIGLSLYAGIACRETPVIQIENTEVALIDGVHRLTRRGEKQPFTGWLEFRLGYKDPKPLQMRAAIRDGQPRGEVFWYSGKTVRAKAVLAGASGADWPAALRVAPEFNYREIPGMWRMANRSPGGGLRQDIRADLLRGSGDALFRRDRPASDGLRDAIIPYSIDPRRYKNNAAGANSFAFFFTERFTLFTLHRQRREFEIDYRAEMDSAGGTARFLAWGIFRKYYYEPENSALYSGLATKKPESPERLQEEWSIQNGVIKRIVHFSEEGRETLRLHFDGCCIDPSNGGQIRDDAGDLLGEIRTNGQVRIFAQKSIKNVNGEMFEADRNSPPRWEGNILDGAMTFIENSTVPIRRIYSVKNSVADGPYLELDQRDRVLRRGAYRDGLRDGIWTAYSPDGIDGIRLTTKYKNGLPVNN